jgi:hypothetical protein
MLKDLLQPVGHRSLRKGKQVNLHKRAQFLFVALTILPVARAQQSATTQSSPAAPVAPLPPDSAAQSERTAPAAPTGASSNAPYDQGSQAEPDTSFLSGTEIFGLGSLYGLRHSFDPALYVAESRESGLVAGGHALSTSGLGGSLNLEQHSSHYHLTVAYRGAEAIYQPSFYGFHYLPYHDATISQRILLRRWTLRLRNDVVYSWESDFTGLFTGGQVQAGNAVVTGIQPSLVSSGTIQTDLARQLHDTALGEVDYARSRRTTLTFVGSYSLARFLDPGYINSENIDARVGYNYALSAKNSIGVTYDYNRINFADTRDRLQDQSVQLAFGRKVTGRLAFQIAAGPQLLTFANFGPSILRELSWSAFSAMSYQWHGTGYSLSYFRSASAGSGVYLGSTGETVTVSVNRQITRSWSASLNGEYAINKALLPAAGFASQFDDWFASAKLNRQIGPQIRVSVNYAYQQQTSRGGACPVSSCSLPGSFSQLGVNLQWHPLARGR